MKIRIVECEQNRWNAVYLRLPHRAHRVETILDCLADKDKLIHSLSVAMTKGG